MRLARIRLPEKLFLRIASLVCMITLTTMSQVAAFTVDDFQCANQGDHGGTCFYDTCGNDGAAIEADSSLSVPADFNLADKIGQLLTVGVTDAGTAASLEKQHQIGGFLLNTGGSGFSYSKSDISNIKQAGELPALFAVDEEGGEVSEERTDSRARRISCRRSNGVSPASRLPCVLPAGRRLVSTRRGQPTRTPAAT